MSQQSVESVRRILETSRVVAVLGAHEETFRPAFYVPSYLSSQGYRILPVNPQLAGRPLFGETVAARLDELQTPVDLVVVFRRPGSIPAHLPEILAMQPRPRAVWLQQGIRHDPAARQLEAEGIEVVQDRCTMIDHRVLGLGPRR